MVGGGAVAVNGDRGISDKEVVVSWCGESFRDSKGIGYKRGTDIRDKQREGFISESEAAA